MPTTSAYAPSSTARTLLDAAVVLNEIQTSGATSGRFGILESDLPRPRMPGHDALSSVHPGPRPSCPAHHEETVHHARRTDQTADEREPDGTVTARQEIRCPIGFGEGYVKPLVLEGSVRVGQITLQLRHVMSEHQPQAFDCGLVGKVCEAQG